MKFKRQLRHKKQHPCRAPQPLILIEILQVKVYDNYQFLSSLCLLKHRRRMFTKQSRVA
jgi:hypothetical protein